MNGLFRWAGGKGRIADRLFAQMTTRAFCPPCAKLHDARFNRWIEPFVGGGAMALEALRRGLAHEYILADASNDVMSVYDALRNQFTELWLLDRLRDFAVLPKAEQRAQFLDQRPAYAPQFRGQQARRSNRAYRIGVGKTFPTFDAAAAAYKLADVRAIIQAAADLCAQPTT